VFSALKEKLFGQSARSKSLAKSRLHFVLVQDRTGLTNEEMAAFKSELVGVIERYFVIDKQGFDIDYRRESDTTTLLINSPVIVRRQDTIDLDVGARKGKGKKAANAAPPIPPADEPAVEPGAEPAPSEA
jgi:cell division topological specificity factor